LGAGTAPARKGQTGEAICRFQEALRLKPDHADVRENLNVAFATKATPPSPGASTNPWLFRQIREHQRGEPLFIPRGTDVLAYVRALYEAVCSPAARESAQVQKMKKYLNYLGVGVEPTGQFLHQVRRVTTTAALFRVCEEFLDHDRPMPLEPFPLALKEGDLMAGEQG